MKFDQKARIIDFLKQNPVNPEADLKPGMKVGQDMLIRNFSNIELRAIDDKLKEEIEDCIESMRTSLKKLKLLQNWS